MKKWIKIWILAIAMMGCENTTFMSSVPSYPVQMVINILGEYPNFVAEGSINVLTFTSPRYPTEAVGYAGLLIYTAFDNQYHACDLCCPKCLKRSAPVEWDGGFYTHCPTCGEDYDLSYGLGIPTRGISNERLRPYTALYGNGRLTISQQ